MFLNPIYRMLQPKLCSLLQQRAVRPVIQIGKEKFQLSINVKQFNKEELRVKARSEYVIVEGKQERRSKKGYVVRQFVRKFKLPYGCSPETMQIHLSKDGVLTVTAPRQTCDRNLPCETIVPITEVDSTRSGDSLAAVQQPGDDKPKDDKS